MYELLEGHQRGFRGRPNMRIKLYGIGANRTPSKFSIGFEFTPWAFGIGIGFWFILFDWRKP